VVGWTEIVFIIFIGLVIWVGVRIFLNINRAIDDFEEMVDKDLKERELQKRNEKIN